MSHNLTNFLPSDRVRQIRTEYFLRLLIVALLGIVLVVCVHAVLLFPTYRYVVEERNALATHLAELSRISEASNLEAVSTRLHGLRSNATRIAEFTKAPPASAVMSSVLNVSRAGITLSGITMDVVGPNDRRMRLTGNAATREALRQYHQALSQLPFVSKADLPLSSYAKESDIPFTILLSGALTP